MVGFVNFSTRYVGWQSALFILPVMYWIYRSYQMYLGRLEDEKRPRQRSKSCKSKPKNAMCKRSPRVLQRTIEGLALAIDAKDHTTHRTCIACAPTR